LQDNVHVSFESIIDLSEFSLRIPQADAEKLPDILQAVLQARREEMQRALGRVATKWARHGVTVTQLDWIGTIRYPQVILDSIQAKTKADADAAAAQAQVAVAKAQADARIEEARGQAEANRLIAQSIAASPGVVQLRAIEKWDGKLPQVTGSATPFIDLKKAD
jgi:regulator of protease activity HflC (stomatin/prohibitin superfamily)